MNKVLFVADRLAPRLGMERALTDLLLASAWPFEVELIVLSGPLNGLDESVLCVALNQPPGISGRLRSIPTLSKQLRAAGTESPIVAVGIWSFICCAIASIFFRSNLILWEHTLLPWRLRNEPKVLIAAVLLRILAFKCSLVVAVSEASMRITQRLVWPACKAMVVQNPIIETTGACNESVPTTDSVESDVLDTSTQTTLVGAGTLNRRKNWSLAISAMEHLPENYVLRILGEGPSRSILEKLIIEKGLAHRICLLGYSDNVDSELSSAELLVHPSKAETFGYVLFEAAEHGLPVVALDRPVMNEEIPIVVPGVLAVADTPEAYADAVLLAMKIPSSEIQKSAGYRQELFSTEAILGRWSEVLCKHTHEPRYKTAGHRDPEMGL